MTDKIVTRERITAMCHINRWRGWTTRPYSVGEHVAIGANTMSWFSRPAEQMQRWWMHDMHETEIIGDVPTPDKCMYVNAAYDAAVEEFDVRLGAEMGLGDLWWRDKGVKDIDRKVLIVENELIAVRKDPALPEPDHSDPMVQDMVANMLVGKLVWSTPDSVIRLYNKHALMYGWEQI